jgi:broad specificity phosphatase PhoE
MKTIYLVRHGESESNAGPINKGSTAALTERGRIQAASVAERCATLPIEVVIASPFPRTKETAEIIAQRIGKPVEYSELFVERRRPSEQKGMSKDTEEFKRIDAAVFENMPVPGYRYSDEENFDDQNARAAKALEYLVARPEEHILLVGHGTFTTVMTGRAIFGDTYTGTECLALLRAMRTSNTGLSILRHDVPNSALGIFVPWMIVTWNDHAHLG